MKPKLQVLVFAWIAILLIRPLTTVSQTDYEFWFVAPAVTYQTIAPSPNLYTQLNRPIALYFTTPIGPANIKIEQPANPSFTPILTTATNYLPTEVILTPYIDSIENKPANTVLNRGLRITSDKPITAKYEVQSPYNAATYTLDGRNALGTEFLIPSQSHYMNYPYTDPPARNVFDIVAAEDSTIVTIIPKSALIGHLVNDTFEILLNRGQTWSGRAASNDSLAHLGGTFVYSNNPIAITITDDAVVFPNTQPDEFDIAGDQLVPMHQASTNFIMNDLQSVPGVSPATSLIVYGFEDSTEVTCRDSLHNITKLINRGEYAEFSTQSDSLSWSAVIHSSKPVIVYYFAPGLSGYSCCYQAIACMVPPMRCGGSRRVSFSNTPPFGLMRWWTLFIITRNGYQNYFTGYAPSFWDIIPGTNGEYVGASASFAGFPMYWTTTIENTKGYFQLSEIRDDEPTATVQFAKYSYYTDFSALYLGPDKHFCTGDSVLLDAGYGKDSYLWNTGDTTETIKVTNPGTYWVVITRDTCTLSDTIVLSYYWNQPINLGPDRKICPGDSILLNAGPGRAWYQWSTGDSTQTIWVVEPGIYWVRTQDVHCIVSDTVQVTFITGISLGPDRTICPGDSTLLDAGYGMTSYLWNTGDTTQTIWARTAGNYYVTIQTGVCVYSDTVNVSYKLAPVVNLGPDTTICTGQFYTFDAGFCSGCTYQWDNLTTNQMNIGSNQTYTTGIAGIYRATVTGLDGCKKSDSVQLFVEAVGAVSITIIASADTVCEGTELTFTAIPVNGGTSPIYQWKVNSVSVGTNSPVYTYSPSNGDTVICVLTSSDICTTNNPVTSSPVIMVINSNLVIGVTIVVSANPVCSGIPVTFTATPVNGGTNPNYQWKVNGDSVGGNSPVYTYTPANGDTVICVLTSSEICTANNPVQSSPVIMVINSNLVVGVSVAASQNPSCSGIPVTFTATPVSGGTSPTYQWKVNGVSVGGNSPVYTYTPVNGDAVICVLTSSEVCTVNNPFTSSPVIMVINSNLVVGVTIAASANPVCAGTSVTFTATPANGGTSPIYQWKVNGIIVGTNSPVYTYSPANGDVVICVLTSSELCTTNNPVTSGPVIMVINLGPVVTFSKCNDTITTTNAKPFKLKGGIPLSGTYSGPGVNPASGIWNPAAAGVGNKTITYSYTNAVLCSASASRVFRVVAAPAFACGNTLTDVRDNQTYQTVQIGGQCWLASNLNYGSLIPASMNQRDNCINEKYCYNDLTANCELRTANYQWDELMQYSNNPSEQGLCPPSWHIPTEAEWQTLFSVYNGPGFAASPLLSTGFSGFNAMVNGSRFENATWQYDNFATHFWTSTSWGSFKAWSHAMNNMPDDHSVSTYPSSRSNALSVRCVKD